MEISFNYIRWDLMIYLSTGADISVERAAWFIRSTCRGVHPQAFINWRACTCCLIHRRFRFISGQRARRRILLLSLHCTPSLRRTASIVHDVIQYATHSTNLLHISVLKAYLTLSARLRKVKYFWQRRKHCVCISFQKLVHKKCILFLKLNQQYRRVAVLKTYVD